MKKVKIIAAATLFLFSTNIANAALCNKRTQDHKFSTNTMINWSDSGFDQKKGHIFYQYGTYDDLNPETLKLKYVPTIKSYLGRINTSTNEVEEAFNFCNITIPQFVNIEGKYINDLLVKYNAHKNEKFDISETVDSVKFRTQNYWWSEYEIRKKDLTELCRKGASTVINNVFSDENSRIAEELVAYYEQPEFKYPNFEFTDNTNEYISKLGELLNTGNSYSDLTESQKSKFIAYSNTIINFDELLSYNGGAFKEHFNIQSEVKVSVYMKRLSGMMYHNPHNVYLPVMVAIIPSKRIIDNQGTCPSFDVDEVK